ncbi:MAG: single-stranded-DNA-specific exonuclease RecJ [Clostridiales bacterium]|nr:single-stranded-DNA-specific exonuclease RecJ [Clostridiales bacterium]
MFDNQWIITKNKDSKQSVNDCLLSSRNISDIDAFLNPTYEQFHDPFTINEMDKVVERIISAIYAMEKIVIYGDYDVDGITSTTMLVKFIRELSDNIDFFIPNRLEQGYGLSIQGVNEVVLLKPDLLITVDCGVVSFDEVTLLKNKGVDVIITDHHQPKEQLPDAYAILCNTRADNTYENPYLSSSGLTYKLLQALDTRLSLTKNLDEYLQLATLGLVADVVPLVGENRAMVSLGLKSLRETRVEGIKALFDIAGINKNEPITTYHLGYMVCPRINATGRMDHAKTAVSLLLENSQRKATLLASKFDQLNIQRQMEQKRIYDEVIDELHEIDDEHGVIILGKENWHHGIIGIVASKVQEFTNRPVILLDIKDGIAKGSGRSIKGFNLVKALNYCSDYLIKYGGHEKAAGVTLNIDNIDNFRKSINEYYNQLNLSKKHDIIIDLEISSCDITEKMINELNKLQPYGESNKRPTFLIRNVSFSNTRIIGKGKNHFKGQWNFDCLTFNCEKQMSLLTSDQSYDIVCYPNINIWNNKKSIQLIVYDYQLSSGHDISLITCILAVYNKSDYKKDLYTFLQNSLKKNNLLHYAELISKDNKFSITRKDIIKVYKVAKKVDTLSAIDKIANLKPYQVYLGMEILHELSLIAFTKKGLIRFTNIIIKDKKQPLEDSVLYNIFKSEQ